MSGENSILDSILNQYKENTSKKANNSSNTFDLKNYFTTYLPDGVNQDTKRVRILPVKGGKRPFTEVYLHKGEVDGKSRKFPCLKHMNNEACPFCEAREQLLAEGTETSKKLARQYSARKYYILKVIDRQKEDEGPKFWRFPHSSKKDGVYDKIHSVIIALHENITDAETGRDLTLTIQRVEANNGGTYPSVTNIIQSDKLPLSPDAELAQKWVDDERTWENVYSTKPYDYLDLVVNDKTPAWSKKLEKWVDKDTLEEDSEDVNADLESEITMGSKNQSLKVESEVEVKSYAAEIEDDEDESDDDYLPF